MSDRSSIEWTDATWNPIRATRLREDERVFGWYCEHVSSGCEYCYAEGMNHRLGTGLPFKPGHRNDVETFLDEKILFAPLYWKKPRRIFVGSMTDLFGAWVADEWLDRIFAVMVLCPQHVFQCLTKRPARMQEYIKERMAEGMGGAVERRAKQIYRAQHGRDMALGKTLAGTWPWPHTWLGVSAEDQATADERIPLLLNTPAAVRFVSLEPLLGPIDLTNLQGLALYGLNERKQKIDWVIVGGESGPNARPSRIEWMRSLRDQCQAAGIPYFFKQWGAHRPDDPTANRTSMVRVGKKAAGRLLDGVEWNQFPRWPQ